MGEINDLLLRISNNDELAFMSFFDLYHKKVYQFIFKFIKEKTESEIEKLFLQLQKEVKDFLVSNEDASMEKVVGQMLMSKNETISTAESCTGGYISQLLTSIPGSSAYFDGSMVTYSYNAKENLLGVKNETLINFGAVSEEVVKEMAMGLLQKMQTNYAIAVSGIMGPAGGTVDKPVGTVWIAVASENKIVSKMIRFRFDRAKNIQLTAANALLMLRELIVDKP